MQGEELKHHDQTIQTYLQELGIILPPESGLGERERQVDYHAFFSHGLLLFTYDQPIQETSILVRFANVFEQTYTRFLDLQKAEALAREARIEAGLERVRSRTMAMHSSQELTEVMTTTLSQLKQLDFIIDQCGIHIPATHSKDLHLWACNPSTKLCSGDTRSLFQPFPLAEYPPNSSFR